jgi:hypothetical protein
MRFGLIALAIAAMPLPAMAQTPGEALLAAEDTRFHAELTHDAATLDKMTANEVVYSHFTGQREDKAGVMQTFTHLPFSSITPSDRYARVIGDVGVVRGKVTRQLPDRTLSDGYLAVYVHRDGRWQLLEWVSASAPKP